MTKEEFKKKLYEQALEALDMADNTEESKKQVKKEIANDPYEVATSLIDSLLANVSLGEI